MSDGLLLAINGSGGGDGGNGNGDGDGGVVAVEEQKDFFILICTNSSECVNLKNILESFKSPISEEQAWALIYQFVTLYASIAEKSKKSRYWFSDLEIPDGRENINLHKDGSVHCSWTKEQRQKKEKLCQKKRSAGKCESYEADNHALLLSLHRKILRKLGLIVYSALDYGFSRDEQVQLSQELEDLIAFMTCDDEEKDSCDDDCIDEGIDEEVYKRWEDEAEVEDVKYNETKDFDKVLEACKNHIKPAVPEVHYKAVCRALVTETIELRVFLQHVLNDGPDKLHAKVDAETTKQELAKLGFVDWARFWVQVIDELRQGVRLKKNNYERTPIEYELTPYEILMEDIRSKKYQLRKVMINGDIPPRVKKDAHALILEFIRSRPPLRKASLRVLPPPVQHVPSPREQLMDSIRKGQTLKHISPPETPPAIPNHRHTIHGSKFVGDHHQNQCDKSESSRSKQRLIKVDLSLLQDEDTFCSESTDYNNYNNDMELYALSGSSKRTPFNIQTNAMRTKMRLSRRINDANEAEDPSRSRTTERRHTIVGCQSNEKSFSTSPAASNSRLESELNGDLTAIEIQTRQDTIGHLKACDSSNIPRSNIRGTDLPSCSQPTGPWNKSYFDEKTWNERGEDRLSLTLEEIVHIRSVMTKAELESLPVGVRVKEDVEKRKVCFLCLRTRFTLLGQWGTQCKICQRTVCSKCYTKMHIPSEHFRKVPLVLISPSLLSSPITSSTPSPSHHLYNTQHASSTNCDIMDETFPKTLIDRLLRTESESKTCYFMGSTPSSPRHQQRSNMSTPGGAHISHDIVAMRATDMMTTSYTSGTTNYRNHGISALPEHCTNIKNNNIMSRSMEGPRSLPSHSPARAHSNSGTLERKSRFGRAFMLSGSGTQLSQEQKENIRGELVTVCLDCKGLVVEISRATKQTRSSARNKALKNLTLDLTPVYK